MDTPKNGRQQMVRTSARADVMTKEKQRNIDNSMDRRNEGCNARQIN